MSCNFLFNIKSFTEARELSILKHSAMKFFNTTGSGQRNELVYRTTEGHGQLVLPGIALMRGQDEKAPHQKQKGIGGAIVRLCEHQCDLAKGHMR